MTEGVTAERSRRGDKIPAGEAQRNFLVPRGHAPHPLPPPVVIVCAGGGLAATGGGEYSIHLISKGELTLPLWNPGKGREEGKLPQSPKGDMSRLPPRSVLVPTGHQDPLPPKDMLSQGLLQKRGFKGAKPL